MIEPQDFTLAMFSPHVGDKFQVEHEAGPECLLELVEAVGRDGEDAQRTQGFALVFHDPAASADSFLPQATYSFKHEQLGTLQIFVVPIGPEADSQGMRYEAVFTQGHTD